MSRRLAHGLSDMNGKGLARDFMPALGLMSGLVCERDIHRRRNVYTCIYFGAADGVSFQSAGSLAVVQGSTCSFYYIHICKCTYIVYRSVHGRS